MIKIVGVRFRKAGKIYYFDPAGMEIETGTHVIVETARGIEFGTVMIPPREMEEDGVVQPLKPVIRIATEADEITEQKNKEKEKEAFQICLEKIAKHKLEMKLVEAGVRDETTILGGIGICGRPLCCRTYLSEFIPVSIKMAKEQNLSLNPTKISGVCGRLMCCLKNEEETYEYLNSRLPNVGDYVTTIEGLKGEVQSVSVLRQLVKVIVEVNDEKEIREYKVDELKFRPKRRRDNTKISAEEMKKLKALEDNGGKSKIDDTT